MLSLALAARWRSRFLWRARLLFVALLISLGLLTTATAFASQDAPLEVQGLVPFTGKINDALAYGDRIWLGTSGGLEEYERSSHRLLRSYTTLDGLPALEVTRLTYHPSHARGPASRENSGALRIETKNGSVHLRDGNLMSPAPSSFSGPTQELSARYFRGSRVTKSLKLPEGELLGTALRGAFLGERPLSRSSSLPGAHVTALTAFQSDLWIGTFNSGLARLTVAGEVLYVRGPGPFINTLLSTATRLYVGTSEGLFSSADGVTFTRDSLVTQAVVGLAHDGTSVWAATSGALYRVKDGAGPPSDVWWMPGGSRSLQKLSAAASFLWIGTEDRGAVRLDLSPALTAKDKQFSVFDKTQGLDSSWSLAVAGRPNGSALMTTLREGLVRIHAEGSFEAVHAPVSGWGLSVYPDLRGVWVGTQGGAAYVPDDKSPARPVVGLPDQNVHVIYRDPRPNLRSRVWLGTENGLCWVEFP